VVEQAEQAWKWLADRSAVAAAGEHGEAVNGLSKCELRIYSMSAARGSDSPSGNSESTGLVTATTFRDHHVVVLRPYMPLLEPVLTYSRRFITTGGPTGYEQKQEDVYLYERTLIDGMWFAAGLLPRAAAVLRANGYEVKIKDRREPGPRLERSGDAFEDCDDADKNLLDAVGREPLGQIEVAPNHAADKCVLIGRLYPQARIVLAVATRKAARALWRELESLLGEEVGLTIGSAVRRRRGRWLVSTFGGISRREAGAWDILVLPHGEEAAGRRAGEMVFEMHFRRVYAFIRPQGPADRMVRLLLEQIAGPVIHRIGKRVAPMRVVMLPTPACKVDPGTTPLERKRGLYWRNARRNQYIASVAQTAARTDCQGLLRLGLRYEDMGGLFSQHTSRGYPVRVAVLVESLEHGRQLMPLLPGWPLLGVGGAPDVESGGECQLPAIVTVVYASTRRIDTEVVIRATGTEWPMRMTRFRRRTKGKLALDEVLVIDFVDGYHAQASRDARRRLQHYRETDITVVPPPTAPTEQ
jgi:hypothetical protein